MNPALMAATMNSASNSDGGSTAVNSTVNATANATANGVPESAASTFPEFIIGMIPLIMALVLFATAMDLAVNSGIGASSASSSSRSQDKEEKDETDEKPGIEILGYRVAW